MFRRKKKEETAATAADTFDQESEEVTAELPAEESVVAAAEGGPAEAPVETGKATVSTEESPAVAARSGSRARGNRVQKVGTVSSDKMQKTVVVRVDRLVLHPKYRRYVRRTSKFMAHDDLGATIGDRVRIVETRPLSAHKRWRVVEIVQKAAK